MAVVQLGGIITGLAGSVGGTNFRRTPTALVMSNKSAGRSRNLGLTGSRIPYFQYVIGQWAILSQSVRDEWALAAENFQFPDKFGVLRNITGRQLFVKLYYPLYLFGKPIPLAGSLDSFVQPVNTVITKSEYDSFGDLDFVIQQVYVGQVMFRCQVQIVPSFRVAPVVNRRKFTNYATTPDNGGTPTPRNFSMGSTLQNNYPLLGVGSMGYLFVEYVNFSGFTAARQVLPFTLTQA
jgi:hypothetical protein